MFSAIYIEDEIANMPRVKQLLARFSSIPHIRCERYGEIFNRKAQNFRLQKKSPALILAKKYGNLVLPSPEGYGFDNSKSYYFSHMLNCVYDCRYCFLQGMYSSANYVLFVNYEDFETELVKTIESGSGSSVYYSGYDCDSLALEPVSKFCQYYIPIFSRYPQATLEIRTKSTQIRSLLETEVIPNCVIAMSFTVRDLAERWEHKVPSISKRIEALRKLQAAGWKVALRFEPLIFMDSSLQPYENLFEEIFTLLDSASIHSVSTGLFRMPSSFYKNIVKLYPDENLFARSTYIEDGMVALKVEHESELLASLEKMLLQYVSPQQYYRCA